MTVEREQLVEAVSRAVEAGDPDPYVAGARWCQGQDIDAEAFRDWLRETADNIELMATQRLMVSGVAPMVSSVLMLGFQTGWTAATLHREVPVTDVDVERRTDALERALLTAAGWFPWGAGAWIQERDEGTVVPQSEAVDQVLEGPGT